MPQDVKALRVLAASPGDVSEERTYLEEIVRELNLIRRRAGEIELDLVRWETHTYPGVGEDAQDVINKEIPDDYDIFLGILWTRFGTATKRAPSGTAEEFNQAYQRHRENPNQIHIMFYFKDAPVTPSELDIDQFALVKKFRKQIESQGVFHWSFKTRDDFGGAVRLHLNFVLQDYGKTWGVGREPQTRIIKGETTLQEVTLSASGQVEPEQGFLDLIQSGQKRIQSLIEELTGLGEELSSFTKSIGSWNRRSAEITESEDEIKKKVEAYMEMYNSAATDMEGFVARLEVRLPEFGEHYAKVLDAFGRAVSQAPAFDADVEQEARKGLSLLQYARAEFGQLSNAITNVKNVITTWPPMTTRFTLATKQTISVMERFTEQLADATNLTAETEKGFKRILYN